MSKKEKLLHEQQEKNAELQKRKIIEVQDVSMRFRLTDDKIMSLKEFVTRKLSGKYKTSEFWALKDVSFDVYRGEVVGIIGHNGAGKSTILKVISGILKPTEGSVICGGNIVPMLELGSGFDHDLTGRENIFLNGAILGYTEDFLKSKYDEIVAFSELGEFIDVPIRNYSSGMADAFGVFDRDGCQSADSHCGRNSCCRRRKLSGKKPQAHAGADERRHDCAVCVA